MYKFVWAVGLLLQMALSPANSAPANSEVEHLIVRQVELGVAQSIADLEEVVNINSGTMNFDGVRRVGEVFGDHFNELGFAVQWLDGQQFDRAGHIVATRPAATPDAVKILLIGHLDTVFSKDDPFQTFQQLDDRYAAGPGITDMKGGNVIMLNALRALEAANVLDQVNIKVVLTGDEESSGKPLSLSKKALIDAAIWADIALGFEDGDGKVETAVIARRGSVNWNLTVTGKPAHSSQIFQPEIGAGAIFEVARILNEFRLQLAGFGDLTFNPGLILGGTEVKDLDAPASKSAFGKRNVIAKTAVVEGGLRALTEEELQHAKDTMQNIVLQNLPHTLAQLTIDEGYPPLAPSDGNKKLLALYSNVSESLGYGPVIAVNPRNAGAADISFTAGHVNMALDGLGLMGRGGHTRDEVADLSTLQQNASKAAILIYRLANNYD